MTWWLRIGGAVLSGVLTALLFPPYSVWPLAWVSMLPLLAAMSGLEGRRAWKGFGLGMLAGTASCLIQFQWLSTVSWLGAIVLPLYLALYWAAFGAFAAGCGRMRDGGVLRMAFSQAAVWAGLELLRGWMFTGFAWNPLGVAFAERRPEAQAADLLGVGGLSLLLIFTQAVVFECIRTRAWRRLEIVVVALLLMAVAAYGVCRIHFEKQKESLRLKVLMVQLNVPQQAARQLWTDLEIHRAYEDDTVAALERLKSPDGMPGPGWPDWVLWPETALTGRFLLDGGDWATSQTNLDTLDQVHAAGPFTLICGANELEAERTPHGIQPKIDGRIYNSIAVLPPDGGLLTYRKAHLVIFGETIPFVDSVPWLRKIYEQQSGVAFGGSFAAGESFEPVPVRVGDATVGAIPTICFEDSVARLTRKFVRPGPQVIVNVTNDGWFKTSPAAAQHFANSRFRAIELRRPMLRCANTGVTAAVDSTGSTGHPETGIPQVLTDGAGTTFTRGSLFAELDVPREPSFSLYAVIGDWGLIGLVGLGLAVAVWSRKRFGNPETRNRTESSPA